MGEDFLIVDEKNLKEKIYSIRGVQVMLDFDLAHIYGYTVNAFNQQVKRNAERFPKDFLFELSAEEMRELSISQNVTSIQIKGVKGGRSKPIKAFTESGIYMLMTVLRGSLAVKQSQALIRLFKDMKDYIRDGYDHIGMKSYISIIEKLDEHSKRIYDHENYIEDLKSHMVKKDDLSVFMRLFDSGIRDDEVLILDGEPFKADLAYQKIYSKARTSVTVIDDYIGVKTLRHFVHAAANVNFTVVSDNKGSRPLRLAEYNDFQAEYPGRIVTFLHSMGRIHDRYIILDEGARTMKVYHCGASSKDAGKKITIITRMRDLSSYKKLVEGLPGNPVMVLK